MYIIIIIIFLTLMLTLYLFYFNSYRWLDRYLVPYGKISHQERPEV